MKNEHIDPICGMTVTTEKAAGSLEREGKTYYFCSKGCLEKFKKQSAPAAGVVRLTRSEPGAAAAGAFHQPADPDIHIDPVCKMSVTPETAATEYEYEGKKYYFCAVGCKERFAPGP